MVKKDLTVKAYRDGNLLINSPTFGHISDYYLTLYIEGDEIDKLPFGGIWEAKLIFQQAQHGAAASTRTDILEYNLSINLKDSKNVQIWFPQFLGQGDVQLDLNMRPVSEGGNPTFKGSNILDMCLYDGYSTNYSQFQVKALSNGNERGRFTLKHESKSDAYLPYDVLLSLSGTEHLLKPGVPVLIDYANKLEVNWNVITALDGSPISIPVLCWPAKLKFTSEVTNPLSGSYKGNLDLLFTVGP
ncbi:hypothetical protein LAR32_005724 [Escherichia coli]|nr:hypothetical protein [Escherichia coli]